MILQALTEYYEALINRLDDTTSLPVFGWSQVTVQFALFINAKGELIQIVPLGDGKNKTGQTQNVPLQLKRSGTKPPPYFLCDSAMYVLGLEGNTVTPKSKQYFSSFSAHVQEVLSNVRCPEADAVLNFLQNWDVERAATHPAVENAFPYNLGKGKCVFYLTDNSTWVLNSPAIQNAWNHYYEHFCGQEGLGICLVTGRHAPIARIHNSVKGLRTDVIYANGWTLVGFDKGSPAFSSYCKEQGYNAPTSQYAAFAYTTALNHLLSDRVHTFQMGDATVVFWAKSAETAYQDFFGSAFGDTYEEKDLRGIVKELCRGHQVEFDAAMLDPNMDFYVLGLSPNAARLSVRFFLHNTFGGFLQNIQAHRERLRIVRPAYEKFEVPSLKKLLEATVNQKSKDKQASPELAGEMLRAILNDTPYPATLLNGAVLRIRAEHEITWPRAAILNAYYLKKPHREISKKEVLTVSLNEVSSSVPYNLGRLFSVLEAIQQSANPGINSTIKDKYFSSASATPAVVFPVLINLAQKHLKKLGDGQRIYFEKQLQAILDKLGEEFPTRLSLPQQGAFQLGYYHQTQARYQKKEEN